MLGWNRKTTSENIVARFWRPGAFCVALQRA